MSHFDSVTSVGPDFEELGYTTLGAGGAPHRFAAIGSDRLRRYGFQFHPEVDDTVHGDEMIANFVLGICGCRPSWTMERYVEERGRAGARAGRRAARSSCSPRAASTRPWPRGCSAWPRPGPPAPAARRQRPDAQGREPRRCSSAVPRVRPRRATCTSSTPATTFLDGARRRGRARAEAAHHRRHVHRGLRARGAPARHRRAPARPGHDLPGHDRDRRHEARRHDQDPPQPRAGDRADDRSRAASSSRWPSSTRSRCANSGEKLGIPHDLDLAAPVPRARARRAAALLDGARTARELRRASSRAWPRSPRATAWSALALPIRRSGVKADLRSYEHPVLLTAATRPGSALLEVAGTHLQARCRASTAASGTSAAARPAGHVRSPPR